MTKFDADKIYSNCALGKDCKCVFKAKPWLCPNWGKSKLANPNVISAYSMTKGHSA